MYLGETLGHRWLNVGGRGLRTLIDRTFDGGPKFIAEFLDASLGVTRNRDDDILHAFLEQLQFRRGFREVHLVGHDDARLRSENRRVEAKFALKDAVVVPRITVLAAGHIDDEYQQRTAFDVAKELVTEAAVFVGAFDETRNVRHDDAVETIFVINHAHIDVQGRERIRRHLRTGGREEIRKRRLAGVRVAHEADVGDGLQHDAEGAFFAGVTRGRAARSLIDRALEIHVAHAAFATGEKDDAFTVLGEFSHETVGALFEHLRARRHWQNQITTIRPSTLATHPRGTITSAAVRLPAVVLQVAFVTIADQDDVATLATVTAVGASLWDKFLTAEADAAVAAVSGLQYNLGFVDKHLPLK